jgi:catechol 2,3-dioxygenase-like lactoylglutathione lyase family enzyme
MASKPQLTHVALWARNVARSVAFYERYCGLGVVHDRRDDGSRVVWVGAGARPRFVIVLIEGTVESSPPSFAHFGFSCRSRAEVDERGAMAGAEGILQLEPRDGGPVVGYYCIVRDPDGNSVEFSCGQAIDPGPAAAPKARPVKRPAKVRRDRPPRKRPRRSR